LLFTIILSSIFKETGKIREAHRAKERLERFREILPSFDNDPDRERVSVPSGRAEKVFYVARKGGKISGFALESSGLGYNGEIVLFMGVHPEGRLTGFAILKHKETLGLGARTEMKPFRAQYVGRSSQDLYLTREEGQIEALSGATVTTKAINQIVREGLEDFEQARPLLPRERPTDREGGTTV
jgi:electron transport complex protein RnfG